MKRKLLIMALGVLVTFGIVRAAVTFVAKPTRAGTLAEVIGDRLMKIDSLVVEGPINAGDFPVMKKATWEGNLSVVNLEKAQIDGDSIPGKAFKAYLKFNFNIPYIWRTKLRRVILPNTLREIGDSAFWSAKRLRTINLPDSLERIGDEVFSIYPFEENEDYLMAYSALKMDSLVFPKKLRYIGNHAFQSCAEIRGKMVLPNHVNIGWGAFDDTKISGIEFPNELGENIDGAFSDLDFLREVRIPEHYPQISASHLFASCGNLRKISIPDSWTYLPEAFLIGCDLDEIQLPSHLVYLEEFALAECGLKTIKFPEGFTTLGEGALEGCYLLESIFLPSTMKWLSDGSMGNLPRLKEIECRAANPPERQKGSDEPFCWDRYYEANSSAIVYVPKGSLESYTYGYYYRHGYYSCWKFFDDIREKDFDESGMDGIGADQSEGDGVTYDLMGRKVSNPAAGGIYIRNGRKIIVKE